MSWNTRRRNVCIFTGKNYNIIFVVPNGDIVSATERMKLANKLRSPSNEVDIILGVHYTLIRGVNFADEDYVTTLDKDVTNIYDRKITKIILS